MKLVYTILIVLFACFVGYGQTEVPYNPTGTGWKYTPKQQSDEIQVKKQIYLNGDLVYFDGAVDGEIIQRTTIGGKHVWTNKALNTAGYDSLVFNKANGILALYKNGVIEKSDTLDGRYALIEDIPTVPTNIWELGGIDRTGWMEGNIFTMNAEGDLVIGSLPALVGLSLTDLSAISPILYNNTTGEFSFDSSVIPNVYPWALASVKPSYSWTEITSKPSFATVATSGSYPDLINKPTIPAAQVNSDWASSTGVTKILNKPLILSDFIKTGLISGGFVERIDSLMFSVGTATYFINGDMFVSPDDTITLDNPDAISPRIDLVVVDTLEVVSVITGTPNSNPQKPTIDPLSQIELTQVLVLPNSYKPIVNGTINSDWLNSGHTGNTPNTIAAFDGYGNASLIPRNDTLFTTIAISDETTALTTGTAKRTFRMPVSCTLVKVRASVVTAPTGANLIFDINEGGVSILSTPLSIDAGEKTSKTAATQPVISDNSIADDAEMTIGISQIGSTVAGAGAKIVLYYVKN